jgi:signal transduction histidine kinase
MSSRLLNIILPIILFVAACTPEKENTDHPAYLDPLFKKADSITDVLSRRAAIQFIDSIYRQLPNAGLQDRFKRFKFLYSTGHYDNDKDTDQPMYLDSMAQLLHSEDLQKKYAVEYAQLLMFRGDELLYRQEYTNAFRTYYKALARLQEYGDSCQLAEFTNRVGNVYYTQGKYREAIDHYINAYNGFTSCGSRYRRSNLRQALLDNIGLAYFKLSKPDSALLYYRKALQFINDNEPDFHTKARADLCRGIILGNMGSVYFTWKQYDTAAAYFVRSIRINARLGYDRRDGQVARYKLAEVYFATNRPIPAKLQLDTLRQELDAVDNINAEIRWSYLMSNYYLANGNYRLALDFKNRYEHFRDSADRQQKKLPGSDLKREFKNMENDLELELLKKKDELKNVYLTVAIVLAAMALLILLLVYFYWKRSRRLTQEIINRNEHLQKALSALQNSQEQNNRMLRVIAHDLRNPIGGITGLADLLLSHYQYTPQQREMLQMIQTSGNMAVELIGDILYLNIGDVEMNKEHINLEELLLFCKEIMQPQLNEKNQQLIMDIEPANIMADKDKLWRVFSNLIANASKFSARNTLIHITCIQRPNEVVIAVKDQGIGIPENLKHKIFKITPDIKRRGTDGEPSFGLGLTICKQIVEAHKGRIWLSSHEGQGTTFFVALPF